MLNTYFFVLLVWVISLLAPKLAVAIGFSFGIFLFFKRFSRGVNSGTIYVSFAFVLASQFVWLSLAALSVLTELPTMGWTPLRAELFADIGYTSKAFMIGFIGFICLIASVSTTELNRKQLHVSYSISSRLKWSIRAAIIGITLYANQGVNDVLFSGGYSGHKSEYWSGILVVFLALCSTLLFANKRPDSIDLLLINLVVFWWLSHGNRSEVLMLFILVNFLFIRGLFKNPEKSKALKLFSVAALLIAYILFSAIGQLRSGGDFSPELILFNSISSERISIQTFGSSFYSVVSTVALVDQAGITWGESIYGNVKNVLPSFIPVPWERWQDASRHLSGFQTRGGAGIWGEVYLNGGLLGLLLFCLILSSGLRALIRRSSRSMLSAMFIITFALYSQRFILYGFVYFFNFLMLFLALFLMKWLLASVRR